MESSSRFQKILNEESNQLQSLSTKWQCILDSSQSVTEDTRDQIRSVVGQTKLLLKEKLQQFRDLLRKYESDRGDIHITQNDLEGFWDLVSIQVNELKDKYSQLERSSLLKRR